MKSSALVSWSDVAGLQLLIIIEGSRSRKNSSVQKFMLFKVADVLFDASPLASWIKHRTKQVEVFSDFWEARRILNWC